MLYPHCFFFCFAPEYSIRNIKETWGGMEMNGLMQVPVNVDDIKLLGETTYNIKNNMQILLHVG
jgi:hypothetical protein